MTDNQDHDCAELVALAFAPQSVTDQHALGGHGIVRGHVVVAVKLLRERIAGPWTLNSLADDVHLSRSRLVRAFTMTVGMSPLAHRRQMRVERMARLLVSTDLSVARAARSVGWRNPFHAGQCFHAAYGVSPTEFRRRHTTPPRIASPLGAAHVSRVERRLPRAPDESPARSAVSRRMVRTYGHFWDQTSSHHGGSPDLLVKAFQERRASPKGSRRTVRPPGSQARNAGLGGAHDPLPQDRKARSSVHLPLE
ncbi:MAG TPA: AraC family transcriptional regulator [Thermomicrobiaceae bacterium]|nr:AraC family transcriptional regulator [Thermomicrobiaceae bacterium]